MGEDSKSGVTRGGEGKYCGVAQNSWEKFVKKHCKSAQNVFLLPECCYSFFAIWQFSSPNREITNFSSNTILVETFSASFLAFLIFTALYCTLIHTCSMYKRSFYLRRSRQVIER